MSYPYAALAARSKQLLQKYGQRISITKIEMGAPDPATGIAPQVTMIYATEYGVLLDFDYRSFGEARDIGTSHIGKSNKRLLVSTGVTLAPSDQITVNGEVFTIAVIKVVSPSSTKVLYDLWIQR